MYIRAPSHHGLSPRGGERMLKKVGRPGEPTPKELAHRPEYREERVRWPWGWGGRCGTVTSGGPGTHPSS